MICTRCGLAHLASSPCPVPTVLPAPAAGGPLQSGAIVGGRFRIWHVAHRSGMSTVYQAVDQHDPSLLVALKEFNAAALPAADRAEALAWLAREAGLLSTLDSPHLPKLLAAFSEGERHYVAMPFLAGETMEERIVREGPQPEPLVLSWGQDLASLLTYLHGQEPPIVHRDLKPANVLVTPDGSLVLLDLGVARPLRRGVPGTAVGTPGYAPPEQYQGLADERSDLFALGATLHRALTGYDPEHAAPFRHPPVRDLRPELGAESAALLAELLALPPASRPANGGLVAARLATTMHEALNQTYRRLRAMYREMLLLLGLASALGYGLYAACFGGVPGEVQFASVDTPRQTLLLALIFAPGLLPFLPLLRPSVRELLRGYPMARLHAGRAAATLLLAWLVPLLVWLANLYTQQQAGLVPVPGSAAPVARLTILTIGGAFVWLLGLRSDLYGLQERFVHPHWRYLALAGPVAFWLIIQAMQAPTG